MLGEIYALVVADGEANVLEGHKVVKAFTHLSEAMREYEELGAVDMDQSEWRHALRMGVSESDETQLVAIIVIPFVVGEGTTVSVTVQPARVASAPKVTALPIVAYAPSAIPIAPIGAAPMSRAKPASYREVPAVAVTVAPALNIVDVGNAYQVSGPRTFAHRGTFGPVMGGKWNSATQSWIIPKGVDPSRVLQVLQSLK